nr:MAG TPA: protein of unknown function DUF285 [Crassvirales sp.]
MFIFKNGSWVNIKDKEIDPLVKDYVDRQYAAIQDELKKDRKHVNDIAEDKDYKYTVVTKKIDDINTNISSLDTKVDNNYTDIQTELSHIRQYVSDVQSRGDSFLNKEVTRATNAEQSLDTKITDESNRAKEKENALQDNITTNATAIATLNNNKQDKLVSGTNIKTVNNESILGEGNIKTVPDVWANILSTEDTTILVDGKKVELPANKNVIIKDFRSVEPLLDENNGGICKTDKIVRFDIHYNGKIVPIDKFFLWVYDYSHKEHKWIETYPNLSSLDVSCFDTSKMTTMHNMFKRQRNITTIDCSGFNTSNVTNMTQVFNCTGVKRLYLQGWDTSKVTSMDNMFRDSSELVRLDQNFNTSNVKRMDTMFCNESELNNIDVSNWDVSNCSSLYGVFYNCHALVEIDLSKWNTKSATSIGSLLYNCNHITYVNVSRFDLTHVTTISNIFSGDSLLSDITFGEGWGKNKATLILDLSTIATKANYKLSDNTYESMLTMYDRIANNLTNTFTIKFSSKHNIPDGWIDKMTARGYTISIV